MTLSAQDTDSARIVAAVRRYFDPLVARKDFSGAIRIERTGQQPIEINLGYADWSVQRPITAATRFGAGSVTKGMTATRILQLVANGKLARNAPVATYLPDFAHGRAMTVDQVLRHTAALPRDLPDSVTRGPRGQGLLRWLDARPLDGTPGASYRYSNVGYEVLAFLAESVDGRPFEAQLASELFAPLGMRASGIARNRFSDAPDAAVGHAPGPPPSGLLPRGQVGIAVGGDGYVGTASDLARWAAAVAAGTLAQLFEDPGERPLGSLRRYTDRGQTVLGVQGTSPGYAAGFSILPDLRTTIVYMTNLESYPNFGIEPVLHAIVLGHDPGPPPLRGAEVTAAAEHRRLTGRYQHRQFGPIAIEERADGFWLTVLGPGWEFYLTPGPNGVLTWRFFNTTFRRASDGRSLEATEALLGRDPVTFPLPPAGEPANRSH